MLLLAGGVAERSEERLQVEDQPHPAVGEHGGAEVPGAAGQSAGKGLDDAGRQPVEAVDGQAVAALVEGDHQQGTLRRAVTGEATGLPFGADRRPPGFGEVSQPLMQDHPLVTGEAGASFVPHRPPRPEKSEGGVALAIQSELAPKGDQPAAIAELVAQVKAHERDQVLLGVTGSGKTFTMAKVIEATQRPALVLAPN